MAAWWSGLSSTQQEIFILSGLLGVFVVGMAVGIFGSWHVVLWEPLMHLGFGTAVVSVLSAMFYFMARIA